MKTRPLKLKGDAVKNNNKDIVHRDEIYINVLWQEELKILESECIRYIQVRSNVLSYQVAS